jgi:apoptosis-inducing factor 3
MSEHDADLTGPDLSTGVSIRDVPEGGMLVGHANGKPVLLARMGGEFHAVSAMCTHYGASLGDGLLAGDTVRCPWHHACFNLRTGEAVRAPALNPLSRWTIVRQGDRILVTEEIVAPDGATAAPDREPVASPPSSVVIVGAGAAGNAAAEALRREGFEGPVTLIGADHDQPYDRPNLSKDYLAGTAPEEWIPLRPPEFYGEHGIDLLRGRRVASIRVAAKELRLDDGREIAFDRLLLATGADPIHLPIPGADLPHVHYLRTLADSRAIVARAADSASAVVMGASFIGLEVAASLRHRGLEVHVVAPESVPLERVMGRELGTFIRSLHEAHGVVFHLDDVAVGIDAGRVTLRSGVTVAADLVVIGAGVRPAIELAQDAGLTTDRGIEVDGYLETSARGIFAAGDIARWPDVHTGERIRVEHWVVAERQGQTAARNILGRRERFAAPPFFWSTHYDATIRYVGHAERWDDAIVEGALSEGAATVRFRRDGRTLAVATLGRDIDSLRAEVTMEGGN